MQIPALVPEIFKFEKCVNYANEMIDDVIHSTQYYIICVNRAILAYLQRRSLIETWQANSSIENTPKAIRPLFGLSYEKKSLKGYHSLFQAISFFPKIVDKS